MTNLVQSPSPTVQEQLKSLETMSLVELGRLYQKPFPKRQLISRAFMERRIAYRIQELVYGGLDRVTRGKLEKNKARPQDRIDTACATCHTAPTHRHQTGAHSPQ